jgi:hypothetical protein
MWFSSLFFFCLSFPLHVHNINTYVHFISEVGQCACWKFSNKDVHLKFGSWILFWFMFLSIIIKVCNTHQKNFKLIVTVKWHSYFAGGPVFKSQVGDQIIIEVSLYSSQSFQLNNGVGSQIRWQPPSMSFTDLIFSDYLIIWGYTIWGTESIAKQTKNV